MLVYLWIAISIGFETVGDVLVKQACAGGRWSWLLAAAAYNLMLFAWFAAINRAKDITLPGTIWLLSGEIVLVIVGHGVFGERVSSLQWIGVGLAGAALVLLSIPTTSTGP